MIHGRRSTRIPISTGANLESSTAQLAGVASASVGFLLMSIGGWLGGRLVYEFGIGVAARKVVREEHGFRPI
jgi:uncharacterized membrane protein